MRRKKAPPKRSFIRRHSLTIVTVAILALWLALYHVSKPDTHLGIFFGNAIADWAGLLAAILGTKYLVETHSAESHQPHRHKTKKLLDLLYRHSLLLFVAFTGALWGILYWRMDPQGKWGEVVGNIFSDWVELGGIIFLTKGLMEKGSEESR